MSAPAEPSLSQATARSRVILDTNILVAHGLEAQPRPSVPAMASLCVAVTLERGELLFSAETLAEFRHVLLRPGFDGYATPDDRRAVVADLAAAARLVEPVAPVRLCRDPDDDMFLALALAGEADWLVTVDRQLLSLRRIGRTRIVRPPRFLEALGVPAVEGARQRRSAG